MRVNIPRSGGGLLSFLQAILHGAGVKSNGDGPPSDKNNYVRSETLATVKTSLTDLKQALTDRERLAHLKKKAMVERTEAQALLERTIRDLWSGLRRRVKRESMPAALLPLLGLSTDGKNPHLLKPWLWTDYARRIIEAEKTATAEGHPPLVYPGVAEVAVLLDRVLQAQETDTKAGQALLAQRKQTTALVGDAYYLVAHVLAELRLALRGRDAVYVRHVIRAYGGVFRGDPPTAAVDAPASEEALEREVVAVDEVVELAVEPAPLVAAGPAIEKRGRKKRKRHRRRIRAAVKRGRPRKARARGKTKRS